MNNDELRALLRAQVAKTLQHYSLYQDTLIGAYQNATVHDEPLTQFNPLVTQCHWALGHYGPVIKEEIQDTATVAFEKALSYALQRAPGTESNQHTTELKTFVQAYAESASNRLLDNVIHQLGSDAQTVLKHFRMYQLADLDGKASANFGMPEFEHMDSIGRRLKAENYIRNHLQQGYLEIVNVVRTATWLKLGQSQGRIDRPGHRFHGREFDLSEYQDLESVYFHPNSFAFVDL
jgi:hypothetical protein